MLTLQYQGRTGSSMPHAKNWQKLCLISFSKFSHLADALIHSSLNYITEQLIVKGLAQGSAFQPLSYSH